jgi:glycosyltransferase involved in cell wall biosynthesis
MRKRVCIFMGRYAIGGVATFTREYIRIFEKNGWEVVLLAGRPSYGEVEPNDLPEPVFIPGFHRSVAPFHDLWALIYCTQLIFRLRPNALITQTAKAGVIGRIAGAICRVRPIIQIFQGHVLKDFYGPSASMFFRIIERLVSRFCHKIVLPKQSDVDLFANDLKIADRKKLTVIPPAQNPMELDGFGHDAVTEAARRSRFREKHDIKNDDCVILMVGRLAKIKNFELAIRVFGRLISQSSKSFKLLIVGAGPDKEEITSLVSELNLSKSVKFLGVLTDFSDVYAGSDIFLHTSRHEGHGIVVVDAMFAGLPVVSSAQGLVTDLGHVKSWVIALNADISVWVQAILDASQNVRMTKEEVSELRSKYIRLFRPQDLEKDLLSLMSNDHHEMLE